MIGPVRPNELWGSHGSPSRGRQSLRANRQQQQAPGLTRPQMQGQRAAFLRQLAADLDATSQVCFVAVCRAAKLIQESNSLESASWLKKYKSK